MDILLLSFWLSIVLGEAHTILFIVYPLIYNSQIKYNLLLSL